MPSIRLKESDDIGSGWHNYTDSPNANNPKSRSNDCEWTQDALAAIYILLCDDKKRSEPPFLPWSDVVSVATPLLFKSG